MATDYQRIITQHVYYIFDFININISNSWEDYLLLGLFVGNSIIAGNIAYNYKSDKILGFIEDFKRDRKVINLLGGIISFIAFAIFLIIVIAIFWPVYVILTIINSVVDAPEFIEQDVKSTSKTAIKIIIRTIIIAGVLVLINFFINKMG